MSLVIDETKLSKELVDNFFDKKLIGNITMKQVIVSIPVILVISLIIKGMKK